MTLASIVRAAPRSVLLIACSVLSAGQNGAAQPVAIRTPIPQLLDDWVSATAGPQPTLEKARQVAEAARPGLPASDPFTPLASMTCAERLAKGERVVWEDGMLMALVDTGNRGSKLLVVPREKKNFPTDLEAQMPYVSRVAAATCDALMVAAGKEPNPNSASCTMRISPPSGLGVRQMHVHVDARTSISAPVDDTFLQRTAAHLRKLVGGEGCF